MYNTCKTSYSASSLGRKDGEGGIVFENEDEKEQWQEDQKVCHHLFLIETNCFLVMNLFVVLSTPLIVKWFCSKLTETGT